MLHNIFLDLIFRLIPSSECQHDKVSPTTEGEYCPDCGRYVVNEWYITRCKCCGVKLQSVKKGSEITPSENFCHNCGGSDYFVEKLSQIDFVNIPYAVLVKRALEENHFSNTTQCWQDDENKNICGLLPYLKKEI